MEGRTEIVQIKHDVFGELTVPSPVQGPTLRPIHLPKNLGRVLLYIDAMADEIWNHRGNKCLAMSVRDYLD